MVKIDEVVKKRKRTEKVSAGAGRRDRSTETKEKPYFRPGHEAEVSVSAAPPAKSVPQQKTPAKAEQPKTAKIHLGTKKLEPAKTPVKKGTRSGAAQQVRATPRTEAQNQGSTVVARNRALEERCLRLDERLGHLIEVLERHAGH